MDNRAQKNELIVKTTLELLQNVLPTNIMANLEQLDASSNGDAIEFANDLDEDRFFFEQFSKKRNQPNAESTIDESTPTEAEEAPAVATASGFQEPQFVAGSEFNDSGDQADNNSSLTYYEIVEQEIMKSLPITKENIKV